MSSALPRNYVSYIPEVARRDALIVAEKDKQYGGSWKARGGQGAFFVIWRKVDRIENQLKRADAPTNNEGGPPPGRYDIFEHIEADPRPESILDDIRDLRQYLMLVEAEMVARGVVSLQVLPPGHNLVAPKSTFQQLPQKEPAERGRIVPAPGVDQSSRLPQDGMDHPRGFDADQERT